MKHTDWDRKAILVVSFGTSYHDSRDKAIGAIERDIAGAFPDYTVRRAFTSQMIIDKLRRRDGIAIDNVEEAVKRLAEEGFGTLIVQPTHVMGGIENDRMTAAVLSYSHYFGRLSIGEPLLGTKEDLERVAEILLDRTRDYAGEDMAVIFMGHGSGHEANSVYTRLARRFRDLGYKNYIVGTVEAEPSLADVLRQVAELGVRKAALFPLMIVAGDHVEHDMAGDGEGSWKRTLQAAGCEVACVIKGLGEYEEIRALFTEHTGNAVDKIEN